MRFAALLLLGFTVLFPASIEADEKSELKKLKGQYKVVKLSRGGKQAPEKVLKNTLVIEGNVFTMITPRDGNDVKEPITAKLDDSQRPKHVTLVNDGKPQLVGIYKLENSKLTFCFNRAGKARPSKFESKAGSEWMLMVVERVKKK